MSTLQQQSLLFNPKLEISNDGGRLSSDGGILLVKEFMKKIQFDHFLQETVAFQDNRKYCTHQLKNQFTQLVLQLIAGYQKDEAANTLKEDPVFQLALDKLCASQPTLSRFINGVSQEELPGVHHLAQTLGAFLIEQTNQRQMILDIDSTHCDTYGKQEESTYNGHYKTTGYHPLLAFDLISGALLGAELRAGCDYTSKGAEDFLAPILQRYQEKELELIVRGDSGFAKPEVYQVCETHHAKFIIRLKANRKLQKIAEQLVLYSDETDFTKEEVQWFTLENYCPNTWVHPYRVVIKSTRNAGEFLFSHAFLVTNLIELSPKQIFPMYQNRGAMENLIKEIKNGFFFDKTDSTSFTANAFRMLLSSVAYNLMQCMKQLVFPETQKKLSICTIRFRLFHIAARVVSHARRTFIQLSSMNVFDVFYWQVLEKIQGLQLYPTKN